MRWGLIILATFTGVMLWRDLKSKRIYVPNRYQKLDYDAPESFKEKEKSPLFYKVVITTMVICCALTFGVGILSFFVSDMRFTQESLTIPFYFAVGLQLLYLVEGVMGRLFSWVKNYGSVDKKW